MLTCMAAIVRLKTFSNYTAPSLNVRQSEYAARKKLSSKRQEQGDGNQSNIPICPGHAIDTVCTRLDKLSATGFEKFGTAVRGYSVSVKVVCRFITIPVIGGSLRLPYDGL